MNMFELNTKVCPIRAVSLLLYLAVDEMAGLYGQTEIQTLRQGAAFVKVGTSRRHSIRRFTKQGSCGS